MKKIVFITPQEAEYGFSLSGVTHHIAKVEDLKDMLVRTVRDPDTGLVIIDERLIEGIPLERLREIEQNWQGILLFLPSPERPGVEIEDYAAKLIRRAIGYHVKVKL